jgi:hypothetical protein
MLGAARAFFRAKVDTGKICVVTHPAFGDNRSNCAQNFAALRSSRRLFFWLGMKRTAGLHRVCFCCQRSKGTMI